MSNQRNLHDWSEKVRSEKVRLGLLPVRAGLVAASVLLAVGGGSTVAMAGTTPVLSPSAVGAYKAAHDPQAAAVAASAAAYAQHNAQKRAMYRRGALRPARSAGRATPMTAVSGGGYAYLSPLNQQGEQRYYWCGPATVSMMAWTVPGPSNVNQADAASWMGTTTNGTDTSQEPAGLNQFVGVPDYGWNFYGFVAMDGNPTSAQRGGFLSDLQSDISMNSPVAGDAWEVVNGPHLVGHPNQEIFHWFEIGGWNTNNGTVYYADPATSVWASVPPYSWYDTYTLETILGGRGYVW